METLTDVNGEEINEGSRVNTVSFAYNNDTKKHDLPFTQNKEYTVKHGEYKTGYSVEFIGWYIDDGKYFKEPITSGSYLQLVKQ